MTEATDTEGTTIELSTRIAAPPEVVWRYWTEPERMCEWWGVAADLDPKPGGACRVTMGQGPTMIGEYVELVPHKRLVFTLGWDMAMPNGDAVPPGSTRVEVLLEPDGPETVLTLRHTGLPEGAVGDHTAGWGHFLAALAGAAGA
ncbi:MAG TPA: SRPBCC domain-containing protein [Acidimicrobiales bacterium]|jgi:uncharacterized protein YndB with AHSA1/START domain|nr:SRPBCC domain-containing protein [Acidimicrobiales bacterium]